MDYQTARDRLLNHANMTAHAPEEESYLSQLWRADRDKEFSASVVATYTNVIVCLEVINEKLNGSLPSATSYAQKVSHIDRNLSYAMQGIISTGWDYYLQWHKKQLFDVNVLNEVTRLSWGIGCAWEAVLAGDIDSIQEHVALEQRCRS